MENRAHAVIAGLFILLLGTTLLLTVMWFRGDHRVRAEQWVVARTGVPGLSLKAAVKLRGVEVGSVEGIAFDPANPQQILIRLLVDASAPLTRGTVAQLGYQGVTGLSFIDLNDSGKDPRPLSSAPLPDRRMVLQPSLLDQLTASGPALLADLSGAAQHLNEVLAPANQQRLGRVLDGADRSLGLLGDRAQELAPTLAALPGLLQRLEQRVDQVAQRTDASLRRADAATEATTTLAVELRGKLAQLDVVKFNAAFGSVQSAAQSFELGLVGPEGAVQAPLLTVLGQTARTADRTLGQLADEPHSLIFGRGPARPGPGESGYASGAGAAR